MHLYLPVKLLFVLSLIVSATSLFATATAHAAPAQLTYQGRILKTDGTPLTYNNVSFIFQIKGGPNEQCLIYQEQVNGVDLSNAGGVFDVPIGTGTVSYPTAGSFTVLDSFNNSAASFACGTCVVSGATVTCNPSGSLFIPAGDDIRTLKVQFYDGTGWKAISPSSVIRSVPFAGYSLSAQKLGANTASDFVIKTEVNNPGSGSVSCNAGNFLTWDASTLKFGCAGVTGASGGTVKTVAASAGSNPYLTVSADTTNPVVTLNVGTVAGTVAAGNDSRLVNAMQTGTTAGGDLAGTYPNPSVAKIQNIAVSATAPNGAGQILRYNGTTQYVPTFLNLSDIRSSVTPASTAFPGASCTSKQTLTWISLNDTLICTAIAIDDSQIAFTTSRAANTVLAAPDGIAGAPSFRTLTAADLPISGATGIYTNGGNSFGTAATLGTNDNNSLTLKTNNTNQVTIATDGKVGIGTVPITLLDIFGNNSGSNPASPNYLFGPLIENSNTTNGVYSSIGFANSTRQVAAGILAVHNNATGAYNSGSVPTNKDTDLQFQTSDPNNNGAISTKLTIKNNGNVGIGTIAPTATLQLRAGTAAMNTAPLKLTSGINLATPEAGAVEYDGTNLYFTDSTAARRTIATTSGGTYTNVTSISNSGGNVTLAPNATTGSVLVTSTTPSTGAANGALVVSGGAGFGGDIYSAASINAATTMSALTSILTPQLYGSAAASGNIRIDGTSHATKGNVLLASAGGNVGIGTPTPNARLHVMGLYGSYGAGKPANGGILSSVGLDSDAGLYGLTIASGGKDALSSLGWFSNIIGVNTYYDATTDSLKRYTTSGGFTDALAITMSSDGARINGNRMSFWAGSNGDPVERMTIATNGNVGVGTSIPSSRLEVSTDGPIATSASSITVTSFTDNSYSNGILGRRARGTQAAPSAAQSNDVLLDLSGYGYGATGFSPTSRGKFSVRAAETWTDTAQGTALTLETTALGATTRVERMRVDPSGNVGIGTATPAAKLDVAGPVQFGDGISGQQYVNIKGANAGTDITNFAANSAGLQLYNTDPTNMNFTGIAFRNAVGSLSAKIVGINTTHTAAFDGQLSFITASAGALVETMRMTGNGNVGIGTAAPSQKLVVANGSIAVDNYGYMSSYRIPGNSFTNLFLGGGLVDNGDGTYTVKSDGASNYFAAIRMDNRTTNTGGMGFYSGASTGGTTYNLTSAQLAAYQTMSLVNGKVGIGTGNPTNLLTVAGSTAGTATVWGTNSDATGSGINGRNLSTGSEGVLGFASWGVYCNSGSCGGVNGWTISSDRRLKTDIQSIPNALDKIMKLDGVTYHWRDAKRDKTEGQKLGLIAQNVEEIFPQAIKTDVDSKDHLPGGTKMVSYTDLIGPMINAIKELYQKFMGHDEQFARQARQIASIQTQKADKTETDALKAENAKLKKENAAIKDYLCSKDKNAAICK